MIEKEEILLEVGLKVIKLLDGLSGYQKIALLETLKHSLLSSASNHEKAHDHPDKKGCTEKHIF